jgi:subtilisin family serine protease
MAQVPVGGSAARFLVRLAHTGNLPAQLPAAALGAIGPPLRLTPLFEAPAASAGALGAVAQRRTWLLAEPGADLELRNPWDTAHQLLGVGLGFAAGPVLDFVEPDLKQRWDWLPPDAAPGLGAAPKQPIPCAVFEEQKGAPFAPGNGFAWHLGDDFSRLASARQVAEVAGTTPVKIVHLDTGFDPRHAARPFDIALNEMRNFVDADRPNDATDRTSPEGLLTNRGHGTGTLGILAGRKLDPGIIPSAAARVMLGGAPLETIVPVRIADSVVHFWTSTVASGIAYAVQIGADVVSMSMGGLPGASWADAVNTAYEAGVVVVCAAGNNFGGLPTSLIVYPARFGRVIAACGIMANQQPYFDLPGGVMQGNVGPAIKMRTALAAYTPNIPWARLDCTETVDLDGAGTSSATPQVAAAAALWLRKNGANFPARDWRRAEAARQALFQSANLPTGGAGPDRLGRGVLNALAALDNTRPALTDADRVPRDSTEFAFLHLLTSALGAAPPDPRTRMHALEIAQLALLSRAAQQALPDPDVPPQQVTASARKAFLEAIRDNPGASMSLRGALGARLAGTVVPAGGPAPVPDATTSSAGVQTAGGPVGGDSANVQPARAPSPISGGQLPRRVLSAPPPARRLRIYATDPGDGRTLETAFINTAIVEVPWESSGTAADGGVSTLRPGPVGEYLEVVDVDPASGRFYPPVDLDDPLLLAQDGLAPSEGNPQFHQQMVYATSMRTIRAFEIALGRRALWAPHRIKVPDMRSTTESAAVGDAEGDERPNDGNPSEKRGLVPKMVDRDQYVRRLRIYPHALRQKNAYYSPEKIALLFGYFPARTQAGGRGVVFTCLSHDVVAHETTHALLDGLHRRFQEPTNQDVLAFHEAFADIVALFQHFTFPELLRFELGRARGDLGKDNILADLAREFGQALGRSRALREAVGKPPTGREYAEATEAHDRGAVLVAAVFDAFRAIYTRRSADLMRLAAGGSGLLRPGALPVELVNRLADEAAKSARHVLTICIRALDYMPPVDPNFGDYLRAIITADSDLVPDDRYRYRVAFLEAFASRGIYAEGVKTFSIESLRWQTPAPEAQPPGLGDFIRRGDRALDLPGIDLSWDLRASRHDSWDAARGNAARLHKWLSRLDSAQTRMIGLDFSKRKPNSDPLFEIHSVRPARHVTPDGDVRTDIIAVITQTDHDPKSELFPGLPFRGGCTLVLDRREGMDPIRYCIAKPVFSRSRREAATAYAQGSLGLGARGLYFGGFTSPGVERFGMLHEHG